MQELIYILQKNPRNVKRAARFTRCVPVPAAAPGQPWCKRGRGEYRRNDCSPRGTKKQPVSAAEGRGERLA